MKKRYSPMEQLGMNAIEKAFLEMGWIKRPPNESDMGVDLIVEECIDGKPTGRLIGIQVKAGPSYWRRKSGGSVSFGFDEVHYDYWIGHSLPIVLALYHPDTLKIVWCHLNLDTCLKTRKGRKVLIPLTQELATSSASEFSKLARRLTAPEFVLEEQRRQELIDPRFQAIMTATATNAHTEFRPRETVSLQLTFSGEKASISPRITDLIERGKPTTFEKSELNIIGTPLFEYVMRDSDRVSIQMGMTVSVTTSLRYCRKSNAPPKRAQLEAIPSTITAGRSRLTLEICAPEFPLTFSVEMARDFSDKHSTCHFGFLIDKWYGQPLRSLPYFETIEHFVKTVLKEGRLEFECLFKGKRLFTGFSTNPLPKFRALANFLALLAKAIFIAKQLNLNPTFRDLSEQDYKDIENLYTLLKNGTYSTKETGFEISGPVALTAEMLQSPLFKNPQRPGRVTINLRNFDSMRFFGKNVAIGEVQLVATSAVISNWSEVQQELNRTSCPPKVTITIASIENCKLVLRLPSLSRSKQAGAGY